MFDDHSNKAPIQIAKNIDLNLKRFKQKRMSSTDFGRGRTVNKYKSKQTACFILIHGIRITHNPPPPPPSCPLQPQPQPRTLFQKIYIQYNSNIVQYSSIVYSNSKTESISIIHYLYYILQFSLHCTPQHQGP